LVKRVGGSGIDAGYWILDAGFVGLAQDFNAENAERCREAQS
jgi:hypothetical protein